MTEDISYITLSRNDSDTIEFTKLYKSIVVNSKVSKQLNQKADDDSYDTVIELLKIIVNDIISLKDVDVVIEIDYDSEFKDLTIRPKIIINDSNQITDSHFFDIAVELSDKYEELLKDIQDLSVEVETEFKNEYIKIITVKKSQG